MIHGHSTFVLLLRVETLRDDHSFDVLFPDPVLTQDYPIKTKYPMKNIDNLLRSVGNAARRSLRFSLMFTAIGLMFPVANAESITADHDAMDAGGPRSSLTYAYSGFRVNLVNQYVLVAGGYWDSDSEHARRSIERMGQAMSDAGRPAVATWYSSG